MKALVKSDHRITKKQLPALEAVNDDPLPAFFLMLLGKEKYLLPD